MAEEEPFADTTLKCKQADSPRKKDKSVWHANRFKLEKAQLQIHTNSKRWKDPELRSSAAVVTTLGLRPWIQSGNMVCMLTKLDFCVFLCKSLKIFEPFWWFPNNVFLSDLKSSFGKWLLPTVCIVFYWLGLPPTSQRARRSASAPFVEENFWSISGNFLIFLSTGKWF